MGEPGERLLLRRPVEPVRPVGDEVAKVVQVGPERPTGILGCVGQRVARKRVRRSSSAAAVVWGMNGSGLGGASGMGRTLRPIFTAPRPRRWQADCSIPPLSLLRLL